MPHFLAASACILSVPCCENPTRRPPVQASEGRQISPLQCECLGAKSGARMSKIHKRINKYGVLICRPSRNYGVKCQILQNKWSKLDSKIFRPVLNKFPKQGSTNQNCLLSILKSWHFGDSIPFKKIVDWCVNLSCLTPNASALHIWCPWNLKLTDSIP